MELDKKIRQLRLKAGLTQEQLATQLGLAPQSVSKWENAVAMPDITALPLLAEIFGVTIDDLFDLTAEQRLNRIENRMQREDELPLDVFREYEEFLQGQLNTEHKDRATDLLADLYFHRMDTYSRKASRYAKESIRRDPDGKGYQWVLMHTDGHACWDWNMHNHIAAINFYRELAEQNPDSIRTHYFLLENLLADRRADEAEAVLAKIEALEGAKPVLVQTYRAHIALARFDAATADGIMEALVAEKPEDDAALFETAQYYAEKCDYDRAIELYERSFACETRRPRYQDALMAIAQIYEIKGDYGKATETRERIIALLEDEWGMTEDVELEQAKQEKARVAEMRK